MYRYHRTQAMMMVIMMMLLLLLLMMMMMMMLFGDQKAQRRPRDSTMRAKCAISDQRVVILVSNLVEILFRLLVVRE